jgi:sec-independent protein translocase protein TatA
MFGFHWAELLVVLALAVAIFGPKRLPEIGGALGKGVRDFRKGISDIQAETGLDEVREIGRQEIADLKTVGRDVVSELHKPVSQPVAPAPEPAE